MLGASPSERPGGSPNADPGTSGWAAQRRVSSVAPSAVHIPALDGLRGVAVLLVVVYHFALYGPGLPATALTDRGFLTLAEPGWIGVDLFFVLSGFLITGILYDSRTGDHYLRNFYARRFLRIFPIYYATLAILALLLPALLPAHAGLQYIKHESPWYWSYLANVRIAMADWPRWGVIGHFWSLAVEEQFYFAWPFVVLLFRRRILMGVCLGFIAGALALRILLVIGHHAPAAAFVLTPARMDALAVGALIALAARGPLGFGGLVRPARWMAAIAGGALLLTWAWRGGFSDSDRFIVSAGLTLIAVFFGAILVLAVAPGPGPRSGSLLNLRSLRVLGKYSYALYVFHNPMLYFMAKYVPMNTVPSLWGSQLPARLAFILVGGAASMVLALLSWHLFEKQFLRLKRFFPYGSGRDARAAAGGSPEAAGRLRDNVWSRTDSSRPAFS